MKVIGLTGLIASGKTVVVEFLNDNGIPVFEADKIVWKLYLDNKEVISNIDKICPAAIVDGIVNRTILRQHIFTNKCLLGELEIITRKFVKEFLLDFISSSMEDLVVVEAPLLFESGLYKYCDYTINIVADKSIRTHRAVSMRNMDLELFNFLNDRQINDSERNSKSDFILYNNDTKSFLISCVKKILQDLQ